MDILLNSVVILSFLNMNVITNIKQSLGDYTKCVVANKFTLIGYVGLITLPISYFVQKETGVDLSDLNVYLSLTGFGGFFVTFGGNGTLRAYKRTKKHIERYHTIHDNFMVKSSREYCVRVGMQLAAKEAGLENLV